MIFKMALRNIFRNRSRTAITLLAIGSGCIAIQLAGGFIEDTIHQVSEKFVHERIGHIRIYKKGFLENGLLHPFDYLIEDPQPLITQIKALPHVRYVAPRLSFSGLLSSGDTTAACFAEGFDPSVESELKAATHIETGTFLEPGVDFHILVGKGLAKAMAASVGDAVVLVTNTRRGALNASDAVIQGTFGTLDKSFDDQAIRLPLSMAQNLLRTTGVQTLIVFLDRTRETDDVAKAISQLIENRRLDYEVRPWYSLEEADYVVKVIRFYQRIFLVLKGIIFIVVMLSVINTMNMAVLERIGEIGTLMALGTKRRQVMQLFVFEGLFLGLLGGILGCSVGALLAFIITQIGIPMPDAPGTTEKWIAHIAIVPSIAATAFLSALAMALASSVFPAMKAAHLETAEALRHNI
jgi:putative ABC transport system permease protein